MITGFVFPTVKPKQWLIVMLLGSLLGVSSLTLADPEPPTVYVSGNGSGDYNCDGVSDQVEINQALDFVATDPLFSTVHLMGPNTFLIDEPVIISSNTILAGDSTATLQLKDYAGWWTHCKPMIAQSNRVVEWSPWGDEGDSISNVEICGFEISGGEQFEPAGNTYVPLIHFCFPHDISIHDLYMHDSYWDIVRLSSTDSIPTHSEVYNNHIRSSGHEGICFVGLTDFTVHDNEILSTRTNCGIRVKDTDNFSLYDNTVGNSLANGPSGYAGILVENEHTQLIGLAEIYGNLIYGKTGGIHLGSVRCSATYPTGSRKDVHIHHNRIYRIADTVTEGDSLVLDGGIKINGYHNTLIEHNVIESGTSDGIVYEGDLGGGSGYQTIVRNNIILSNKGFGINNKESSIHSFAVDYNIVYDNVAGDYNNSSSTTDIHQDPMYGSTHGTRNAWHHIVACYDNTTETFTIYVDGSVQACQRYPGFGTIGSNSDNLLLGTYRGLAHWYEGRQDELAIWDRALSSAEVALLYNGGVPTNIEGALAERLQAYLKMEDNWADSSGNDYNAEYSTATFTPEAIGGEYAGLFDGIQGGVQYPTSLRTTYGLTISVWTYRTGTDEEEQTILCKGSQSQNRHVWLYYVRESVLFELGNGTIRECLEANIVNPETLDYHVQSEYGRWNGFEWVNDSTTSPCVDQGDPEAEYSLEPYPNGGRVNIGVYGNTEYASKSESGSRVRTDQDIPWNMSSLRIVPNPFVSSTQMHLSIPRDSNITVKVYSVTGRLVDTVMDGATEAGPLSVRWDASEMNSGMYFVRLRVGGVEKTCKCLLTK